MLITINDAQQHTIIIEETNEIEKRELWIVSSKNRQAEGSNELVA